MNARLGQANLSFTELVGAHLELAHLERANLSRTNLERASLIEAHCEETNLFDANLEGAILLRANLEGANLRDAHLDGANLQDAVLDQADLRAASGVRFDNNSVFRAKIEGNAKDPWSVLRRKYTGPWFFVHLLLVIAFFTPYVAKFLYLSGLSRAQDYVIERAEVMQAQAGQFEQRLVQIADEHEEHTPWLGSLATAVAEQRRQATRQLQEDLDQRYAKTRALWVLIGITNGWWAFGMALVVIVYNLCRGVLTLRVSGLRDAEERAQVTPRLEEYWPLYQVHRVTRWLLIVAISVTVFNVGFWAWKTQVYTPTGAVAGAATTSQVAVVDGGG